MISSIEHGLDRLSAVCQRVLTEITPDEAESLAQHPRAWWLAGAQVPREVEGPVTQGDAEVAAAVVAAVAAEIARSGAWVVGTREACALAPILRAAPAGAAGLGAVAACVRARLAELDPLLAPYHGARSQPYGPLDAAATRALRSP